MGKNYFDMDEICFACIAQDGYVLVDGPQSWNTSFEGDLIETLLARFIQYITYQSTIAIGSSKDIM